jgi:hypothetical protein
MISFLRVRLSFHLSSSLYFMLLKKVGCYEKKEELSACHCSFLFVSFFVFRFFCSSSSLSPRLLIVGFFKSLFVVLLITHAHIRLQTQCAKTNNDNDQAKHTLSTQCNHFRLLAAQL